MEWSYVLRMAMPPVDMISRVRPQARHVFGEDDYYMCLYGGFYERASGYSSNELIGNYSALGQTCNPDSTANSLSNCEDPAGQICGCTARQPYPCHNKANRSQ